MSHHASRSIRARTATATLVVVLVAVVVCASACDTSALYGTPGPQPGSPSGSGGASSNSTGNNVLSNPGGGLPAQANKPPPPLNTFQGCPASGDGGDGQLNIRKNRTDSAPWYPVSIASILSLQWPRGIEGQPRSAWSLGDTAEIARYEGIPVQVEGWLAGAKQQGPESCNCHSVNDVDNHLWIVDSPGKDRSQAVVVEVTPRVRAMHPGWAFQRIQPLVDGQTKVRISGWLMMDQEHPDQVGKTRGTIWEIHPIIAFDVQRGGTWLSLDTGRVSTTTTAGNGSEAAPTEDPNLPPPISEPVESATMPTATALPAEGTSRGRSTSSGPVQIDDIFYNGVKGSNEPDEYVEIANTGSQSVNMDGWVLHDIYGGQEFTWHGFTLQGGQKIRVYTNEAHPEWGGFSFNSSSAIWANKGDAAELIDATSTVVSTFAYGNRK